MKKLTNEEFIERARNVHGDKYDYSLVEYKKSSIKVSIVCPQHGIFKQTPNNHLKGKCCPKCKNSMGERSVKKFLDKNKIKHICQYKVYNENLFCVNRFFLVDFYLPEYNIFIEYNGRQHYKPITVFGGQDTFQKQTERDSALRQYCKEHNYTLIEIDYNNYGNIDKILTNSIKGKRKKTLP